MTSLPLLLLERAPRLRPSAYERFGKPLVDRFLGATLLLATLPLLAVVVVAVRCTLGGPALLRQQRVGRGGAEFTVLKVRTMHPDRRGRSGPAPYTGPERRRTHKDPADPRLTALGRLLRKLSLDELPQLVNVVRGDMSLVGPRPELPHVVAAHYLPEHHRRHEVKPGLTGLWQITERGNGAVMHQCVELDLAYIDRVSAATDLAILLRTPFAALGRHKGV